MGIINNLTSKQVLADYRERKRQSLREGLRLESLENRVVFSGASPVAVNDLYEAVADEPLEVQTSGLLANDTDAEGDALTALEFLGPKHGELSLNEDGTFVYQPDDGFSGVDGFLYQVDDGTSQSAMAAVTIQVTDPNVAPEGSNDAYALNEDDVLTVLAENGVLVNDEDANGDALTTELIDAPEFGALQLQDDGSFVYTPQADFHGTDAFTYRLDDGALKSDLMVVELTVNPTNDAPLAAGESYSIAEDETLDMNSSSLLDNDSDVDSTGLQVILQQGPENGELELNADGTFRYTPNADFYGNDSFSYVVSDGISNSNVVDAEIVVSAVNDLPIANNDAFTLNEDEPFEAFDGVLINDLDPEGVKLAAQLIDAPQHGVIQFNSDGTFRFEPDENFHGTDAFTYRVCDDAGQSELAVVELMVTGVNDAPIAVEDAMETDAGTPLTILASELLVNDSDIENDDLVVEIATQPENGTLTQDEHGDLLYTPDSDFVGEDSFSYLASDGADSTEALVSLMVHSVVPERPVAINESYTATAGETLSIDALSGVLANETVPVSETADEVVALADDTPFVEDAAQTVDDTADTLGAPEDLDPSSEPEITDGEGTTDEEEATDEEEVSDGTEFSDQPEVDDESEVVDNSPVNSEEDETDQEATESESGLDGTSEDSVEEECTAKQDSDANEDLNSDDGLDEAVDLAEEALDEVDTIAETAVETTAAEEVAQADELAPLEAVLFRGPNHGQLQFNPDGSFEYTPDTDYQGIDSIIYRTRLGDVDSQLAVVTLHVQPNAQEQESESSDILVADPSSQSPSEDAETQPGSVAQTDAEPAKRTFSDRVDDFFQDLDDFWLEIRCFFS